MPAVSHNYGGAQDAENLNFLDVTSNGFFGRTTTTELPENASNKATVRRVDASRAMREVVVGWQCDHTVCDRNECFLPF